jgi:4-amino-4-deoxy-L-arabinose transferase-like glycosyltransferase
MRNYLLLAAIAAPLFFFHLGHTHLWDVDEAIFSQAGKEMFQRGDVVVPSYNGDVFPDKPAMMYWMMISAYQVFGPSEFAARFWSAVFGIGSVLLTYRLGTLTFSRTVGFVAGLILATSLYFNLIARAATPDSFLIFFCTLAVLLFVEGTKRSSPAQGGKPQWPAPGDFRPSWRTYALVYAAMGLGVLTKGPIGVLLPSSVIGLFLLVMRARPSDRLAETGWRGASRGLVDWVSRVFSIRHFFRVAFSMRLLLGAVLVLAIAGPWYLLVDWQTDSQWTIGFFGTHNFGRFLHPMEHHGGSMFYYVAAIALGFFPWSVLLGPTWLCLEDQMGRGRPNRAACVLMCSWIAVWVGFFSLAGTKLPNYVMPAYPALAVLTGCFVDRWLTVPNSVSRVWTRLIWGTVALTGVGMMIGLPIAAQVFFRTGWQLGALGLIPLAAAAIGITCSQMGRPRAAVGTLAGLGVAMSIALFGFGGPYVDQFQDSPRFAKRVSQPSADGVQPALGAYNYMPPSYVFYTDRIIERCRSKQEAWDFFANHPGSAYLLTFADDAEKLKVNLPPGVEVLETEQRFLRSDKVVLLGRVASGPSTAEKPASESSTAIH